MNATERYTFDLNGYVIVHSALSDEQLMGLNQEMTEALSGKDIASHAHVGLGAFNASTSPSKVLPLLEWGPHARNLIALPKILPYVRALVGQGFRLDHQYAIRQAAGKGNPPNPLHGGGYPFDPAQYYLVQGGHFHNGMVVVSYSLTDVPLGAGGFCCIPASHKSSLKLPRSCREISENGLVSQVPLNAGDAVIFTEALTHGTLSWESGHERRALLFKYAPGHLQWQEAANRPRATFSGVAARALRPPYASQRTPSMHLDPAKVLEASLTKVVSAVRGRARGRNVARY